MRPISIDLADLLDIVNCAEAYGHGNDVLLATLAEWAGPVSDAEIAEYADRYLTPDAVAKGYTAEDRREAAAWLTAWCDRYGTR